MIKNQTVAICDICGHTELAASQTWRNETEYCLPSGWKSSAANSGVHLCPACVALWAHKLNGKTRTEAKP